MIKYTNLVIETKYGNLDGVRLLTDLFDFAQYGSIYLNKIEINDPTGNEMDIFVRVDSAHVEAIKAWCYNQIIEDGNLDTVVHAIKEVA
jgi:hypothetical protein